MFAVSEAEAAAIRVAFGQRGEFVAAIAEFLDRPLGATQTGLRRDGRERGVSDYDTCLTEGVPARQWQRA